MAIEADLDEMAYYVFEEFKLDEATQAVVKENGELTKFGNYLNDGLITQKTVSKKTNITVNKLSLLANDGEITLFARDVFLTALATKRKPSTGFLAVSGHLQLNSPERQEELRLEYEAKLAAAKAKRDTAKEDKE